MKSISNRVNSNWYGRKWKNSTPYSYVGVVGGVCSGSEGQGGPVGKKEKVYETYSMRTSAL